MAPPNDVDRERVLWCGNLHDNVTEELLYELFLQAGPLESVKINQSKERGGKNYAFITFKHTVSVPFTVQLMSGIRLFGTQLQLKARNLSAPDSNSAPPTPITPNVLPNNNNGMSFQSPHPLSRVLSYPNSPATGYPDNRAPLQRWNSESESNNPLRADQFGYGGNVVARHDSRNLTPQTKATPSRNGSNWSSTGGGNNDQRSGGGSRWDQSSREGHGDESSSEALSMIVSQQLQQLRQSPQLQQQFKQSPQLQQQFKQSPQLQQVFRDCPPQHQQQRHSPQQYGESPYRSPQEQYAGRQSNSGGRGGPWPQQREGGYHPYAGSNSGREQYHRRR